MSVGPLVLAFVSVMLIVAGVVLMLRDFRPRRPRDTAVAVGAASVGPAPIAAPPPREAATDTPAPLAPPPAVPPTTPRYAGGAADVTIVRREITTSPPRGATLNTVRPSLIAPQAHPPTVGSSFAELQTAVALITTESSEHAEPTAESQRWPSVEARWPQLEVEIEGAVQRLNAALARVALQIGPTGDVGWSFKNRGYGAFRRVSLAGRSIAWLRTETNHQQVVIFKLRAHALEQALLNATQQLPAIRFGTVDALEALSRALRPTAEFAAWTLPQGRDGVVEPALTWANVGPLTNDAFNIASGALREAEAVLTERSKPAWDRTTGRYRWPLDVAVGGAVVARVSVDLVKRGVEVACDPVTAVSIDTARRQRLELDGLTAHALAEAIATCAWPALASALEAADAAGKKQGTA